MTKVFKLNVEKKGKAFKSLETEVDSVPSTPGLSC